MELKEIDRQAIKMLRGEIKAALSEVEQKYGLTFDLGGATFTPREFNVKLSCTLNDANGEAVSIEALDFQRYAKSFGITKQLGDKVLTMGNTYEIVGLKPRSHKYPLLVKDSNGKLYKLPARYGV